MIDIFGARPQADPEAVARVKQWVIDLFQFGEEVTVMVTELRCAEPGCPPLETVIALLASGQSPRQHKLHMAVADVTQQDIAVLAQSFGSTGKE